MKRWAGVLLLAALMIAPASAATDPAPDSATLKAPEFTAEPVFRVFNLLGNWAFACDQAASPRNPHVSVTAPGGGLIVESHDVGPQFAANLYHFIAARRLDKDSLEASVLFRPGAEGEEAQTIIMRIGKAKGVATRRTIYNRGDDGVRVKNGVALSSGLKTPVLKRCG
ncbi:MAG: hypothetical protein WC670_14615 [Pseudolabrys sp.]